MNRRFDQAIDMGIGAGVMYFFDPDLGKERRMELGKQALGQVAVVTDAAGGIGRRARERAMDVVPSAKVIVLEKLAMDQDLLERAKDSLSEKGLLPMKRTYNWGPQHFLALLAAAALGAALMYVFDPRMGRRRRSQAFDQMTRAGRQAGEAVQNAAADAQNRAQGVVAEATSGANNQPVSDTVLAERVRSQLQGVTSHPGSIDVAARNGWVTLTGPILADEVDGLLARVRSVPGVTSVENHLQVYKEPGRIPGLQGRKGS